MKVWMGLIIATLMFNLVWSSCGFKSEANLSMYEETTPAHQQKTNTILFPQESSIVKTMLDSQQNLIIAGQTNTTTIPVKNAFQKEFPGENSGFIAKISPEGEKIWCTYLGGSGSDYIHDMFMDSNQHIVILGVTNSNQFALETIQENDNANDDMYFFRALMTLEGAFLHFQRIPLPPLPMMEKSLLSARMYGDEKHCFIFIPWSLDQVSENQEFGLDPLYAQNAMIFADYAGNILWTKDRQDLPYNVKQVMLDTSRNSIYFAGSTSSTSFPLVKASVSEYTSDNQSNAFLMNLDDQGAIQWSTFLWNHANEDSIADSMLIDDNGWLHLGGRIITYNEGKDSSAGNLSAWNPKTNISALWQTVDQTGQFKEAQKREEIDYPYYAWSLMNNFIIAFNQHNTMAFACNLSLVEHQDELMMHPMIHPYQAFPFGASEGKMADETNIIYKMNHKGEIVFSTYYGGSDLGSFVVEDIKLSYHEHLFVVGQIHNLNPSFSSHLDVPPEVFDMENQIAFVSVFNPEGQKMSIILFGMDE